MSAKRSRDEDGDEMSSTKTNPGNFFEDFRGRPGDRARDAAHGHRRRRRALHRALRLALRDELLGGSSPACSASTARRWTACSPSTWCSARPSRTSRSNAVANLGYASGRFGEPGLSRRHGHARPRPSSACARTRTARPGVVYVRSIGVNQRQEMVLDYCRWVMVRKKDAAAPAPEPVRSRPARRGRRGPAHGAVQAPRRPTTTPSSPAARTSGTTTRSARRSTTSTE